jgi:hypothetical protein
MKTPRSSVTANCGYPTVKCVASFVEQISANHERRFARFVGGDRRFDITLVIGEPRTNEARQSEEPRYA